MLRGKHSIIYFEPNNLIKKQFLSKDLRSNFYKEIIALQKLSKYSFVPKLIYYDFNEIYIIMEYVYGISLKEFLKKINLVNKSKKKILIKIYKILMKICILLDIEGVFKDEWLRPFKHVILNLRCNQLLGIYIIDFDRSSFNKELKNFPQFLNFIFNNLGFREYFYLIKDISNYYVNFFYKYLVFK